MIELVQVSKVYNARVLPALAEITFQVAKGSFVYLIGPSGAGKTTLLKLLCAAERPTGGEIRIDGMDVTRLKHRQIPRLRRKMGFIFQDLKLLPRRTVFDNVAVVLEVLGARRREVLRKTAAALRMVGLERKAKFFPPQLSGGEQQRVAIARAIANDPPLLLADEPTGNIDMGSAEEILRLFQEVNSRGTTVVLATHNAGLAALLPRQRIVLEKGRLLECTLQSPGLRRDLDAV